MEVRAAFGAKVRSMVKLMNKPNPHRASKYAAMMPLAGMDPNESNRWCSRKHCMPWLL